MAQPGVVKALEIATSVLRNWWTVIAGLCLGVAGGIVALSWLPEVYEAKTKILVAPQKIPQDFVRSTINTDFAFRLSSLRQAVLSKPYMEELIDNNFPAPSGPAAREGLIKSIRERVDVSVSTYEVSRDVTAGYFDISYRDTDPERAADVVNFLARRYIEENTRFRATRAEETTDTLRSLAERVRKELEERERQIAEFRSEHLYETPEQLSANLQLLEARREELAANQDALQVAREKLRELEARTSASDTGVRDIQPADDEQTSFSEKVQRLRDELEELRSRYRPAHPDVRAKERELEQLLAGQEPSREPGSGEESATSQRLQTSGRSLLEARIEEARTRVQRLEKEAANIRAEIAKYRRRIEATPKVEQRLNELTKGLDVLREQYDSYQAKVQEASSSEMIEQTQKGEQFELLEEASVPKLPISPDPRRILLLGVAGGLVFFVGPLIAKALLLPRVASEAGLELLLGHRPLVTVPRIRTRAVRTRRMFREVVNAVLALAAIATLVGVAVSFPGSLPFVS